MIKIYRRVQQWDHWLTESMGVRLLEEEKSFLSSVVQHDSRHAVLIGVPHQKKLLPKSLINKHTIFSHIINKQKIINCVECDYNNLPILPASVDLILLPHTLELVDNPRQVLADACKAVKPEGLIIILGFNPWSLWGIKKWWLNNKNIPWSNSFLPVNAIKNWLKLADFALLRQDMIIFRPPIFHSVFYEKLKIFEWLGRTLHLPFGGVYVLIAQAKVMPLTSIRLHWKQKLAGIHTGIPKPTMRDIPTIRPP